MYTVETLIATVDPSITYPPSDMMDSEWSELVTVFQMGSDQEELQEARKVARQARQLYWNVRIVRSAPGGARSVVR